MLIIMFMLYIIPALIFGGVVRAELTRTDWTSNSPKCRRTNTSEGKIHSMDCFGFAEIKTIDHSAIVKCDRLSSAVVYGPFIVNFSHCISFGIGEPLCHPGPEKDLFSIPRCKPEQELFKVLFFSFLVFVTIINLAMWRCVWIRLKYVPKGYICLYRTGGKLKYELTAKKDIFMNVKFDCERERTMNETQTYNRERFLFDWKIMLMLLFFLTPKTLIPVANAIEINKSRSLFSHTIRVSEGDLIREEGNTIKVTQSSYILNWVSAYVTSPFTTSLVADWHCTGVCESGGRHCADIGPFGHWSNNITIHEDNDPLKPVYIVDYCMPGTSGCFGFNGCWKWVIGYHMDLRESLEVMTITGYEPYLEYELRLENPDSNWKIKMLEYSNWNHDCLVRTKNNDMFVCGQCSFLSFPEAGKIGELQMNNDNSILVSHEMSSCQKDKRAGPECSVMKSSLKKHLATCEKVSDVVKNEGYYKNNGMIKLKRDLTVLFTYVSKNPSPELEVRNQCGGPVYNLWAVKHSGKPAKLMIHPRNVVIGDSMRLIVPCLTYHVNVPCDEHGIILDVSWPNVCFKESNNVSLHVSDSRLVDYQESSTLHYEDAPTSWSLDFPNIFSGLHLPSVFSIFGLNFIIVIVGAVLIFRK